MRTRFRIATAIALTPILAVSLYIGFLWVTYIDNTVVSGKAYGFTIGASKNQSYTDIEKILKKHQKLIIYISYGPRAGDNMTISPIKINYKNVKKHNHWDLLLDGENKFFNTINLIFKNEILVEIYRHRKHFELP